MDFEKALEEANRQVAALQGTMWGGALGGLVAMATEGWRYGKNKLDKLTKRIDVLEATTNAQQAQLAQIFVPAVQPGTPSTQNINNTFSSNGGTVSVSGDDRSLRLNLNNGGSAVAPDTKLVEIKFGRAFVSPPKVVMQKVGGGGVPSDIVEVYPDQPTTTGFAVYVDSWVAAEVKATYEVIVFGPQQVP